MVEKGRVNKQHCLQTMAYLLPPPPPTTRVGLPYMYKPPFLSQHLEIKWEPRRVRDKKLQTISSLALSALLSTALCIPCVFLFVFPLTDY